MYRVHKYNYTPIIVGASKCYRIELPIGASPVAYKTLTTGMRYWHGQLIKSRQGAAEAFIIENDRVVTIQGKLAASLRTEDPCYVMEHLNIYGEMEFIIMDKNILNGNQNFVNFGIPGGKHIRIDIYTGDSRIIE